METVPARRLEVNSKFRNDFNWLHEDINPYADGFEDSLKSCQCDWWNDSVEVCGLDGKTYWNSCLAKCKTEVDKSSALFLEKTFAF